MALILKHCNVQLRVIYDEESKLFVPQLKKSIFHRWTCASKANGWMPVGYETYEEAAKQFNTFRKLRQLPD